MTEDEKKALDSLQDLITDTAKGKAEEFKVYQKANDIVKKHPILATTIKTLVDKEIGVDFNIGENKQIGFMINPKDKQAKLGFKMSFEDGGFINTYQSKGTVTGNEWRQKWNPTFNLKMPDNTYLYTKGRIELGFFETGNLL